MQKTNAIKAVVEVIRAIQEKSGRECPPLNPNTCPMTDVPGFEDSLVCVEATVEIADVLHAENLPVTVFAPDKEPLRIGEIAERICNAVEKDEI